MNWYSFLIGTIVGAASTAVIATIVVRLYILSFIVKFFNALGGSKKDENS